MQTGEEVLLRLYDERLPGPQQHRLRRQAVPFLQDAPADREGGREARPWKI